jgi:hypothetical protein
MTYRDSSEVHLRGAEWERFEKRFEKVLRLGQLVSNELVSLKSAKHPAKISSAISLSGFIFLRINSNLKFAT